MKKENGVLIQVTDEDLQTYTMEEIFEGVMIIGNYSFRGCKNLTSITIPTGVTSIGVSAFENCYNMTSMTVPASVTSIGNGAFMSCKNLTSVVILKGVTSIGDSVFSRCENLTSVAIPESVKSVGKNAFHGTPWYNNQPDGIVYAGKVLYKYKGTCPAIVDNIRTDIVSISDEACSYCRALTMIAIPEGVTSIGNEAFRGCTRLTSVTIPEGVKLIENNAFSGCAKLQLKYEYKKGKYIVIENPSNLSQEEFEIIRQYCIQCNASNIKISKTPSLDTMKALITLTRNIDKEKMIKIYKEINKTGNKKPTIKTNPVQEADREM